MHTPSDTDKPTAAALRDEAEFRARLSERKRPIEGYSSLDQPRNAWLAKLHRAAAVQDAAQLAGAERDARQDAEGMHAKDAQRRGRAAHSARQRKAPAWHAELLAEAERLRARGTPERDLVGILARKFSEWAPQTIRRALHRK